ncbi:hypothetical protein NQ318_002253 [Aromia moschata]|uniref:Uncharacterized protein n=1 Tax=Aromia moschata TaxID=1265417 RepID=A0AAV8Z2U4_9CUCU|nr:hypothetical protein NQ318_002253 [Aromia moschata]
MVTFNEESNGDLGFGSHEVPYYSRLTSVQPIEVTLNSDLNTYLNMQRGLHNLLVENQEEHIKFIVKKCDKSEKRLTRRGRYIEGMAKNPASLALKFQVIECYILF